MGPLLPQIPFPWLIPDPESVQVLPLWDTLTPDAHSCPLISVVWRVHSQMPQKAVPSGPGAASLYVEVSGVSPVPRQSP